MSTSGGVILDRLLHELSRALPVATFLRALGEPPELEPSPVPSEFWQHDLRAWIRADYSPRLERVLRAYTSLRPEDLAPAG